jgi:peptide/nickel transport system substrate-binding protein
MDPSMPRPRFAPILWACAALLLAGPALIAPAPASAQARDDLVVGMTLEPPHLDPTAGAAGAIDEVTYANVFEGLTRIDREGRVVPGLAESWEVSEDGLEYRFRLRQGVTFHDGTAFDSEDVRFTLERAKAEDSVNAQKGFFEPIAGIATPSPHEVVIRLSRPTGLFLFHLAQGDAVMVAPESAGTNRNRPIGTGPFRFVEWVAGDRVELERWDGYRDAGDIALARVTFRFVADPAAQTAAMLAGDIDVFPNVAAPESLSLFETEEGLAVVIGTTEGETILAVNQRRAPFDRVRVRRALAYAIDRQALIDGAMFGYGTPIGSHFAPHHPAYVDQTGRYPYDPELARELLEAAGLAGGFEATLTLPPPAYARRGGEIVQALLAQVGVQVTLEPVEWAQWLEQVFRAYDYDMTIISHTEPLDIGIYARGEDYYFGYENPEFDAVIAELETTIDPEARAALYADAQRILAEDEAAIFLFQLPKTGVHDVRLRGLWENSPIQANDVTGVSWAE